MHLNSPYCILIRSVYSIVKSSLWPQVCLLYPVLVDCVTCTSADVRVALKDTLAEFVDIISTNVRGIST